MVSKVIFESKKNVYKKLHFYLKWQEMQKKRDFLASKICVIKMKVGYGEKLREMQSKVIFWDLKL